MTSDYDHPVEQQLLGACLSDDLNRARRILADNPKINVNFVDDEKNTILHQVVQRNYPEVVKFLISNGAQVDARNKYGETPLHLACMNQLPENVKYLLDAKADITAISGKKESPLGAVVTGEDYNIRGNPTVQLLLRHGSTLTGIENSEIYRKYYQFCQAVINGNLNDFNRLIEDTKDVDFGKLFTETPLYYAIMQKRKRIAKALVDRGADVHVKVYTDCLTLLDYAENDENKEIYELLKKQGAKKCPWSDDPLTTAALHMRDYPRKYNF